MDIQFVRIYSEIFCKQLNLLFLPAFVEEPFL